MTTARHFAITLALILFALIINAQAQTPSIEVTTDSESAQFSIQGQAQRVHLEVFSPSGELVFETTSAGGQSVEWQMQNERGERVREGTYLATITVTDFLGKRRKRIEQITVSHNTQARQAVTAAASAAPPENAVAPIDGEGTAGKIAKFTGTNSIGDSLITEGVNTVGVGTVAAPTATLQVNGVPPAALATDGTDALLLLQTIGGKGGNTTGTTGQTAGEGASVSLVAGSGGNAPLGSTNGNGGNVVLQPGSPGAGAGAAGADGNVLMALSGVGNVGVGTLSPTSKLTVNGMIQTIGSGGGIKFPDGSIQTKAIAGTINGTGTTNQIVKFTGPNSFGNSVIAESAGNVGIGTSNPQSKLAVNGVIESTAGGIKFPDATTLTSANITLSKIIVSRVSISAANSPFSAGATQDIIGVNVTNGPVTVTLPAANSVPSGKIIIIKNEAGDASANNITIQRRGSNFINANQTSVAITFGIGTAAFKFYSDGVSRWYQF